MIPAVLASVGGTSFWYLTRGSGLVALVVLTASVVLGVMTTVRWSSPRWPRFVVEGLHRNLSLAVVVFLAIHVATTVVDGFVPIGWLDAVIPFRAGYRPVWVGLGALAVDCLLAVIITSLVRVRIGHGTWRAVHWLAYGAWPIALVHGLGAGTDSRTRWMLAVDAVAIAAVLGAVWWRIAARRADHPVATRVLLAGACVVPVLLVGFAWTGPMRPGWSKEGARLGAPATTVPTAGRSAGRGPVPARTSTPAGTAIDLPFAATVRGTRTVEDAGGSRVVTIAARSGGDVPADLTIELDGAPDASGGVALSGGTVAFGPAGATPTYEGPVTGLDGNRVTAAPTGPDGATTDLTADLAIDRSTGAVTGTVRVTATGSAGGVDDGREGGDGG